MTHLVVRAPNWVGDVVMATPILESALSDPRFARVTILLRAHLRPLLSSGPCEAHVRAIGRGEDEVEVLRALAPDAALLLSNSLGAALRARRAGIPVRAGAALRGRGLLLTHRVVPPRRFGRRAPIPTQHLHRDVAGLLGIETPSLRPRLSVAPEAAALVAEELGALGLGSEDPFVFCAPSAAFGAAKLWPPAHFAAALDGLRREHGLHAVVGGGPGEEAQMRAVVEACEEPVTSLEHATRDLETLKAVIARASLVLVGDSGPRWVAAAFGVPCVTVMGPNSAPLTASSLEHGRVVRRDDLTCSPCAQRTCPLGHHACMRDLRPEPVLDAARTLLQERTEAQGSPSC